MRNTSFAAASVMLALAITLNLFPIEWHTAAQIRSSKDISSEERNPEAAFTPGNLVIYRVGDGAAALGSAATAVFLDEYTPAGALVQSIAMPTTVNGLNKRLTASGTATSEGFIGRSNDGQYLVFTGYDADLATAGITTSTSATVNRVIGRIGSSGVVDTTTALNDAISGGNPRGVATTNGTDLWISGTSGGGGIRYATLGATTSVALGGTPTNLRVPGIFDGQLYVSTSSGTAVRLGTVGTGTPTTAGQTITNLPGFPTTTVPYQFFFADLTGAVPGVDTVYVSEDAAAASGGVIKYSLVGGNWVSNGLIVLANTRGLTGSISGSNVTLFATGNGTTLQTVTDATGYNVAPTATFSAIATAGTNTAFRGVAFAPQAAVGGNPGTISINASGNVVNEGAGSITLTVNRTGGTDGTVSVNYTVPVATPFTSDADSPEGENVLATGGTDCGLPGVDFINTSGTLTFVNGDASETFNVTICDDAVFEPTEIFTSGISNPTGGATLGQATANSGIINNDPTPPASIGGKVMNASGRGIAKTRVELYSNGATLEGAGVLVGVANTSTFGYFGFSSLPTGVTYTVVVGAKQYTFTPNSQTFQLNSDNFGVNFTANP